MTYIHKRVALSTASTASTAVMPLSYHCPDKCLTRDVCSATIQALRAKPAWSAQY